MSCCVRAPEMGEMAVGALYGHLKSTRFFEIHDPDASHGHFFNGLLNDDSITCA